LLYPPQPFAGQGYISSPKVDVVSSVTGKFSKNRLECFLAYQPAIMGWYESRGSAPTTHNLLIVYRRGMKFWKNLEKTLHSTGG